MEEQITNTKCQSSHDTTIPNSTKTKHHKCVDRQLDTNTTLILEKDFSFNTVTNRIEQDILRQIMNRSINNHKYYRSDNHSIYTRSICAHRKFSSSLHQLSLTVLGYISSQIVFLHCLCGGTLDCQYQQLATVRCYFDQRIVPAQIIYMH